MMIATRARGFATEPPPRRRASIVGARDRDPIGLRRPDGEDVSVPVTAATALCGIVLHPAGHTRSPAMHNAAYAALGLDALYLPFDVPPDRLRDAIAGVRGARTCASSRSRSRTRRAILELVDEVDETAARIGAANTVVRDGDRLVASNTDWIGAVRALERERSLAGARAVVLGAGGTARAVVFGLIERGAAVPC